MDMRRAELAMAEDDARALLEQADCGRLATVGPDGWPYVVPISFALVNGRIAFHHVREEGHLNLNLRQDTRACFEVDEPGEVYADGPGGMQTSVAFRSVIAFGLVEEVTDREEKMACLEALLRKYASHLPNRFPVQPFVLDKVAVYGMAIERMTGKQKTPTESNG